MLDKDPDYQPSFILGVCPVSSWPPLQIHGCRRCSLTYSTGSHLPQLQALHPRPRPTRTSGSSASQPRTSTPACPTRGKRRSSSRPLNRWPHLAAPMLNSWPLLNTGASQLASCKSEIFSVVNCSIILAWEKACITNSDVIFKNIYCTACNNGMCFYLGTFISYLLNNRICSLLAQFDALSMAASGALLYRCLAGSAKHILSYSTRT